MLGMSAGQKSDCEETELRARGFPLSEGQPRIFDLFAVGNI